MCVCVCVCVCRGAALYPSLSLSLCLREKSLPLCARDSLYLSIWMRERERVRATELLAEFEDKEEVAE
jgi:hypothetical protein